DAELFVLSEKEGVVGRSDLENGEIPFPQPLSIPDGNTPVAMNLVNLEHGPHVAVVAKNGRDYILYLIDMKGERETISLGSQSRSPDTILAIDADQNGQTDLLLLTRDKPMTMLLAQDKGFKLMESKDMGQFGLVQAANADNTAVYDMDGDSKPDLLIADKNFVRAVRYETSPPAGVSPGWQVVSQINVKDPTSKLVSATVLGNRIVAADKENSRLVIVSRNGDRWQEDESLNIKGFSPDSIYAGAFAGDKEEDILAVNNTGFAVIRLSGTHTGLKEIAGWRTTEERRLEHELSTGDLNSDGFTDMVALDAGEQMCEIFTFTQAEKMLYVLGFKVFESRLFSGGDPREFEPSDAIIADVTGDGANDLILLAHDRILLYPQMIKPKQ
ncbi:MAG TPA: VCBS repeat-containing protein, partial [Phycisphaerales bacterium]|nr:VCBS repeat-containing protein [Phycisphaerales bacterium]